MVTVLYSVQKNKIFEQYDNEPRNLWHQSFKYDISKFIGDELVMLDVFGEPTPTQKVMPFGKHKGEFVSNLGDNYLRWVTSIAYGPLKDWCIDEQIKRFGSVRSPAYRMNNDYNYGYDDDELNEMAADYASENFGDRD